MSKKDKLIERFLKLPNDFHYNEVLKLVGYFGFSEGTKGKTSGSRVRLKHKDGRSMNLHKPHPSGLMKRYQLKQIKETLEL